MAHGINKVILVGNLGKDPIVQDIGNGIKKASFTLATTENLPTKDGTRTDHVEWHNIILWRGLAEVAEKYLRKGNQVYIEGRLRSRQYDDRDGNKRYITEILCDNMVMLGGGRTTSDAPMVTGQPEQYAGQPPQSAPAPQPQNDHDFSYTNEAASDDLPF